MTKKNTFFAILFMIFILLTAFNFKKTKILIIGDSISIGYTPSVKKYFSEKAIVSHNKGNAQHTGTGLAKIDEWLGDEQWDIIHFNWGLWDLCYRNKDSIKTRNRDKINGKVTYTVEEYASNLDSLVSIIKKKSKAKLIFTTTTYVPNNEPGRYENDVQKYNDAAKIIMKKYNIPVNDIYAPSINIHKNYGIGNNDVHYTKEGYNELGKLIIDFLETHLN